MKHYFPNQYAPYSQARVRSKSKSSRGKKSARMVSGNPKNSKTPQLVKKASANSSLKNAGLVWGLKSKSEGKLFKELSKSKSRGRKLKSSQSRSYLTNFGNGKREKKNHFNKKYEKAKKSVPRLDLHKFSRSSLEKKSQRKK